MSKAGGIAYLIKHGRAPMPTVTRTPMKGKGYAAGGAPINNSLGYGPQYDYVFVPGGMTLDASGKPQYQSGHFERQAAPAATAPAAQQAEDPYARGTYGSASGRGGAEADSNPGWANATPTEKAAWYAENPTISGIASSAIAGRIGAGARKYDPEQYAQDKLVAAGIDPALWTGPGEGTPAAAAAPVAQEAPSGGLSSMAAQDTGGSPNNLSPAAQASLASEMSRVMSTYGGDSGMAHGGVIHMAAGGIGALPNHGGFVGSYAAGGRMLRGPGDGLSDNIPATIGNKQPARLADGEFVVSADVVSALGGGSTEAGSKKLYAMMDRIRKAAHGSKKQVKPVKEHKVLPA